MKSALPKVLHKVGGKPLIGWAIDLALACACAPAVVVVGAGMAGLRELVTARLGEGSVAVQETPRGTADAVSAARAALAGFEGDVVILYGDAPLVRAETVEAMFALRRERGGLVVLGFDAADPTGYGRLILDGEGAVARIVEERDATHEERRVAFCNSGVVVADAGQLFQLLSMVRNDNAKGEFYLTDVVGLARSAGFKTHAAHAEENEVLGVNSRVDLAEAEAAFQQRARRAALEGGVTMIAPETVYFSHDTCIGRDVTIEPNVYFAEGVTIGAGTVIHAHCHFERTHVSENCEIGPFARFRPNARLERKVKIGNFVEVKNSTLGEGAKANHLAYIGDADVGARSNLGAGAITCNYDGFDKHRTTIGEDVFVGTDTALVAPVTLGARAYTAAGSVITKDVAAGALALGRARQTEIEGWADRFRKAKSAEKAARKADKGKAE
ncbi:MAG: bifunctional UDP-N-acetylglucosamine diphosphorylase/glucosamine-1-phosphate N-acetyltransferase GlmU [Alphaproteobacteria bacterium]|nr:bifunctional UDP-N-acetylglucosamine diphosphorylase/glucosamine-1-phosphate N-acetyltransferase GlmU [Alphaproteobacteria bacterium]